MNDISININIACHYLEKVSNVGACIPVYGTNVILGRLFCALFIQTVAGVFARSTGWIVETSIDKGYLKEWDAKKWREVSEMGSEHVRHGLLNVGVAVSQLIVGFFTLNLGNLFIYFRKGSFDPSIPYKGIAAANSYTKGPLALKRSQEWEPRRSQGLMSEVRSRIRF